MDRPAVSFKTLNTSGERISFMENILRSVTKLPKAKERWDTSLYESLKVVDAEVGKVQFHYTVQKEHSNPLGFVHGGALATIIDICSSLAVFTVSSAGFVAVSTDLSMNFSASAPLDQVLLIVAEVTHHGKVLDFTSTHIYTMDAEGNPKSQIARGLCTKFGIKPKI
ncbi:HotDog domain-containing protein [Chytridium lagenaria]|nr:HotDog domain-containing protein [Chytridium lagenaria]